MGKARATVYDVDGNSYLDFAAGVSVMNIGYNCQKVKDAVCSQMEKMVHCGFSDVCAEMPVKLAEKLCRMSGGAAVSSISRTSTASQRS